MVLNWFEDIMWTNADLLHWCIYLYVTLSVLTHWGWVTHKCVSELTVIGSDNGLSPGRRQAIIWTNAGILLIGPLGTNFSEILIEIHVFSFKKMHLKLSSGNLRPFCLGLNVLTHCVIWCHCSRPTLLQVMACYLSLMHYLVQWWLIVSWVLRSKPQWNLNQNIPILIWENMLKNVICKMVSILSQPQCVNSLRPSDAYMRM